MERVRMDMTSHYLSNNWSTLPLPTRAEQKTSDLYSLSLSFNEVYWDVASMTGCPKNVAVEPQKVGYF